MVFWTIFEWIDSLFLFSYLLKLSLSLMLKLIWIWKFICDWDKTSGLCRSWCIIRYYMVSSYYSEVSYWKHLWDISNVFWCSWKPQLKRSLHTYTKYYNSLLLQVHSSVWTNACWDEAHWRDSSLTGDSAPRDEVKCGTEIGSQILDVMDD